MCSINTRGFSIDTQDMVSIPSMFVSIQTLAVAKVMIFGKMYDTQACVSIQVHGVLIQATKSRDWKLIFALGIDKCFIVLILMGKNYLVY